jgi:hypothetical protein
MNKAAILFAAVLAFGISPFITEPFRGYDPAYFPLAIDRHPVQPAPYAFALWSLIYLGLAVHAIFGLVKRAEDPAWDRPRLALTFATLIGAVWQPIALISPVWGTLTIWPMAIAAIVGFLQSDTDRDRWLLAAPPALFAGWMTAAAAVSTGILIGGYGLLSLTAAASAMLGLVLLIAVPVQRRRPWMPVYGLAVIWALVGIIVANLDQTPVVAILAAVGILLMAIALFWHRKA